MEKMTEELLGQQARGMVASHNTRLTPTVTEPSDGMGLFEASQGNKFKQATSLARLMKKAGTSAAGAKDRIQKKHGLTDSELESVLTAVWGQTEEVLSEGVYDKAVTDKSHLPKKLSARLVRELKKAVGKGTKITVRKSESTMPRQWDYGNYTVLDFVLPDGNEVGGAFTLRVGGGEASGNMQLDAKYGGVVAMQRGNPEQVISRVISEVGDHLKSGLSKKKKEGADALAANLEEGGSLEQINKKSRAVHAKLKNAVDAINFEFGVQDEGAHIDTVMGLLKELSGLSKAAKAKG